MSKQQHPRKAVEAFKVVMEIFNPSTLKITIYTISLALFVGYVFYSNQLTLLKPVLFVYSYILAVSVYSLNRLSQVRNDIEYLSQDYYGDFPVRQQNGFSWETPDGQRIETLRLNKHYGYRLVLMFIGFVLMVLGLYLLKIFV
ncbi:hypothetical protein [Vibrio fluvialis]|uniref:hypothetical protein n=1 Tax=Vibrio fluvialis TaxID=676 RepID=UPI0028F739FB|nr:hypothetical protein [Vibrio fluvialis]